MKNLIQSPKHRISKQLLLGFGLSLAVIGVAALSTIYTSLKFNLDEQVHQRARTITQGLEFASEGLVEDEETFLLERLVQNYATLPAVVEISIVDPRGSLLAHSRRMDLTWTNMDYADIHPTFVPSLLQASRNGTEVDIHAVVEGKPVIVQFLPFSSTVFNKFGAKTSQESTPSNRHRGVVIVVMDLQALENEALKNALWAILAMSFSGGLILTFMGWLIRQLVLSPLAKIQLAIADSENQEKFVLPILPNNEIGFLGATLASVLEEVKDFKQMELDIAERKYAEIAQHYELATNAAKVWIWDWDAQTGIFVLECGVREWLGYESCQDPIHLDDWLTNIYIDDRELARNAFQKHLEGETSEFSCEYRLLDAKGKPHWFLSRGERVLDDQNKVIRAIGTITDIEEVKQAEKLIRRQAKRELVIREITQNIRKTLDLKTIFQTTVEEIRNFLKADRVGIFEFYPDTNFDDGEFVAESVLSKFGSAIAVKFHDHCFGEQYAEFYEQGTTQAVSDIHNSGLPQCYIQTLERFQIRANLVVPLLKADKLWGLLCIHQCDSPRDWEELEIDFVKQIGNQLAIAVQQADLYQQTQADLLIRKQTEAELLRVNQELLKATKLKDEFLANMSHELRTPLNSILGLSEVLKEQLLGTLNDKQLSAIGTVESSGTHLLSLINDILDLSKISSGMMELHIELVSVQNLCNSSLVFVKQQAFQKRIQIACSIPKNINNIKVEERRIRQVLINLLTNAVKFTPSEGHVNLLVAFGQGDIWQGEAVIPQQIRTMNLPMIVFQVMDTGIGIASKDLQRLFQPFIQVSSNLNRQYEGTGLGLALVKQIVELHGGMVMAESVVGECSRFTVALPYEMELSSTAIAPEIVTSSSSPIEINNDNEVAPLILLAEDNEANIQTFKSYLTAINYRIAIARNGEEAVARAKDHCPDIIVMDIQMPKMDGLEAIRLIRADAQTATIPIIALTALAMEGDREKCLKVGANEYLTKPVKLRHLADKVRLLLAQPPKPQGLVILH
ncbi:MULTISPECIES: response regulator [Pseudanabaena]|uniref:response regulator n=1 Tax=Pseudanabaena TaxID=1152 RepID=UPI00247B0137|nr:MULTISPECIES: response regulator [Pseudanabaena]MEA5485183.1 response regulator [Pseudanabaena sp. CCNP1317]WGS72685.1 response regulator [Pseudanabaena galeata CCNP1313]